MADIQTGLTAYWKLDEASGARADPVGGNSLTDVGSVASIAGVIGNAANFSGANYLKHASNAGLQVGTGNPYTLACWVRFASFSGFDPVISKYGAATGSYLLNVQSNKFLAYDGSFGTSVFANTFGTLSTGVWYFVASGYDGVNLWISVNAGTRDTVAAAGPTATADDFNLGGYNDGANFMTGAVDEAGLWARSLADADLAVLYNSGAGARPTFIDFDAASDSGNQTSVSSYSWSHTCTGTDLFLAVDVVTGDGSTTPTTATGITYNSVALTLLGTKSITIGGVSVIHVECWGLVAPAAGAHTVAVTLSGTSAITVGMAVSYTGVNQAVPTEAFASASALDAGAGVATVNVTTVADNDWVHAAMATNDGAVTAGQTSRANVSSGTGSAADEDTGPVTPPASTAMTYTSITITTSWALVGYALRSVLAVNANFTRNFFVFQAVNAAASY